MELRLSGDDRRLVESLDAAADAAAELARDLDEERYRPERLGVWPEDLARKLAGDQDDMDMARS
jgi:hypothetical protein